METTEIELKQKRDKVMQMLKYGNFTAKDYEIEKRIAELEQNFKNKAVHKEVKMLDNPVAWEVIKSYIRDYESESGHLHFFINKNKQIKGKITNKLDEGMIDINLIDKYFYEDKDGNEVSGLVVFGEKRDKKQIIMDSLTAKFYSYRLIAKDGEGTQTYTLLSQQPMENDEYEIEGMQVSLSDFADVSKYTRFMKKNNIIFVNTFKSTKITFDSKEDFIEKLKPLKLTEDLFFKNLLSIQLGEKYIYFQHPRYFERLIASFFLSSKYDSSPYPMHLLIIGKQGGGKSKAMEALSEKIQENIPIVEGSGSTMKSLIPSFKSEMTKAGALIESNRMAFVDEFFRILMRVDKDDREDALTHLNPLLEHKKRRFGSGSNFLDTQMTAKLFGVTNPVFGTSTMEHLVNKMDNSFISRILIWYQDEEHYNSILNKKESELEIIDPLINAHVWQSIYDYCNSFKATFESAEAERIHKEGINQLGTLSNGVKEIYKTRYKHHFNCLLDGVIKLRCIAESDSSFVGIAEDYEVAQEIWFKMLETWKKGLENVRFEAREGRFYEH